MPYLPHPAPCFTNPHLALPCLAPHQVFIADDPNKDVPRSVYVTPETLLCSACQLPECKPGCPAASTEAAVVEEEADADEAAHPAGLLGSMAAGAAAAAPLTVRPRARAAAAADESALSEGRSEDSMLLGLPSPVCSVLPVLPPPGLTSLQCTATSAMDVASVSSAAASDASPTAEPKPKQQRLGGWGVTSPTAETAPQAAAEPAAQPAAAPPAAAGPPVAAAAPESALAAALRSISRGLPGRGEGQGGDAAAAAEHAPSSPPSKDPPLPSPPRRLAPWERPQPLPAGAGASSSQPGVQGAGGSGNALSAALAAISRGLAEDGLV